MSRRADYIEALAEVERALGDLRLARKEISTHTRRKVTALDRAVEQLKLAVKETP